MKLLHNVSRVREVSFFKDLSISATSFCRISTLSTQHSIQCTFKPTITWVGNMKSSERWRSMPDRNVSRRTSKWSLNTFKLPSRLVATARLGLTGKWSWGHYDHGKPKIHVFRTEIGEPRRHMKSEQSSGQHIRSQKPSDQLRGPSRSLCLRQIIQSKYNEITFNDTWKA